MPSLLVNESRVPRQMRYPEQPFAIKCEPYEIRPCCMLPVLMGETVKELDIKSVTETDALASRSLGAWIERHYFYVKLRDLEARDQLSAMILGTDTDISDLNRAADNVTYHAGAGPDFVYACLEAVVNNYFRHDGETIADHQHATTNCPLAKVAAGPYRTGVLDSMQKESDLAADTGSIPTGEMTALQQAIVAYQQAIQQSLVQMTFEDYLAMGGVRLAQDESHIPEHIGMVKEWTLPATGVDQNSGTTQSVWFWKLQNQLLGGRNRIFCEEPGFIFGVQVIRPKIYLSKQTSDMSALMVDLYKWLPPHLRGVPGYSVSVLDAHAEPFNALDVAGDNSEGVWMDVMDYLQYGSQLLSGFSLAETDWGMVALPTDTLSSVWYPAAADVTGLFAGAAYETRTEGVLKAAIASSQATPGS